MEIGDYAFSTTSLQNTNFLKSNTVLGEYVFQKCTALESITIPEGWTSLGTSTFAECANVTKVTFPSTLKEINSGAFTSCSSLKSIEIPEGVEKVGSYAFYYCEGLESVSLPSTLRTIEDNAFDSCSALNTVDIKEGLETVGDWVFSGCLALPAVILPSTLTTLGTNVFYEWTSEQTAAVNMTEEEFNSKGVFVETEGSGAWYKDATPAYKTADNTWLDGMTVTVKSGKETFSCTLNALVKQAVFPRTMETPGDFTLEDVTAEVSGEAASISVPATLTVTKTENGLYKAAEKLTLTPESGDAVTLDVFLLLARRPMNLPVPARRMIPT